MRQERLPYPYLEMVKEFMQSTGQTVHDRTRNPMIYELNLRYKLFIEEAKELEEAINLQDRVEQLDAVCDLLYILGGTKLTFGDLADSFFIAEDMVTQLGLISAVSAQGSLLADLLSLGVKEYDRAILYTILIAFKLGFISQRVNVLHRAFEAVHASNMSKTCTDIGVAGKTVKKYEREGVEAFYEKLNSRYVIYRKEDRKVLKSMYYKPVDLKPFIDEIDV